MYEITLSSPNSKHPCNTSTHTHACLCAHTLYTHNRMFTNLILPSVRNCYSNPCHCTTGCSIKQNWGTSFNTLNVDKNIQIMDVNMHLAAY